MDTKIIHVIRHGESVANVLMDNFARELGYEGMGHAMMSMSNVERERMFQSLYERKEIDYGLTDKGYKQAHFLQTDEELQKDLTLIVSSTQERAIRTAVIGLGHLIDTGQAVGLALDTAREFVTEERGERRTKISDRLKDPDFANKNWDFSHCPDDDEMWKKMQENDSFEYSIKGGGPWEQKRLLECVKVRGNETLDRIFEQKDHRVVALFTHSAFAAMGLVRQRLSAEGGGRLFRGEFANCDRITLKVTKTNSENEPYTMEFVSNRKCCTTIHQLYPTKILHLIRHGESVQNRLMHEIASGQNPMAKELNPEKYFEFARELYQLKEFDYKLTDKGVKQALFLKEDNDYHAGVTLVVSSTQERAIRTAALAFGDLIKAGQARGVALDSAREFLTGEPGERRTKISDRMRDSDFAIGWDFSKCTDEDELFLNNLKNDSFEFDFHCAPYRDQELRSKVLQRGTETLNYIFSQQDDVVCLVSHGGFSLFGILCGRTRAHQPFIEEEHFIEFLKNFGNCDRLVLKVTKTNNGFDVVHLNTHKSPLGGDTPSRL